VDPSGPMLFFYAILPPGDGRLTVASGTSPARLGGQRRIFLWLSGGKYKAMLTNFHGPVDNQSDIF